MQEKATTSLKARIRYRIRRFCVNRIYRTWDVRIRAFEVRSPVMPGMLAAFPSFDSSRRYKPDRPLTVCFHLYALGPGGAERQISLLAYELAKSGHNVHVLCLNLEGAGSHYVSLLQEAGVAVETLQYPQVDIRFARACRARRLHPEPLSFLPVETRFTAVHLASVLSSIKPDVFHSYLDIANTIGGIAAIAAGVPIIRLSARSVNPSNFPDEDPAFPYATMRELYAALAVDLRVSLEANSRRGAADYAEWIGIDNSSIEVVPNGLDLAMLQPSSEDAGSQLRVSLGITADAPVVACILRLSEEKRPLVCVEVAKRLVASRPDARFLHVGIGPMEEEMRTLIRAYGLEKHVLLLGRREDVADILAASDTLLLTSRVEGMPNVVMEAMAAGLPVVSSAVGGALDLVVDGESGFLFPVDDADGMASGLLRLFNSPESARAMGSRGKERIRSEYSIERLAARTLANYRKALSEAQARGRWEPE